MKRIAPKPGPPGGLSDSTFENNPVLLVIDNNPADIRVIRDYFGPMNCVIKTADDGIRALEIIAVDDSIDLVLLDTMMPAVSRCEIGRRIRVTRSPGDLPVIMLTAKNRIKDIDTAFDAGANDYVVKPLQIRELHARVSTMLKLKRAGKSAARRITLQGRDRSWSFAFSEIIYITSRSKNIVVHTADDKIEIPALLKDINRRLPQDMFLRIHKRHIVNLEHIHSMFHVLSGRYRVRLRGKEGTERPVGSAFLGDLRKKM